MPVVHKKEDDDIEMVINMINRNGKNQEIKNKKREQNENRRVQKKKKKMKKILKWTSIIVLVIVGLVFTLTSPLFNISEIKVENNNALSEEKIVSLSGLTKGQNIFRFLKSDVEKNIKEDTYVEDVKINRSLPGTVVIDVKERNRDFSLKFLNGYAYINNQGYILEIADNDIGATVIQGVETAEENIVPGNRLDTNDLKKLEVAIRIMTIAKENEIDSKIKTIDISDKNEYILYIDGNKTANLGDSTNLTTKMLYVKKIMELEEGKEGTIFVNGDFSNKFKAYFREKV